MSTDPAPAVRFESVVPQFTVPDVVRTAEYYRDVLGFEISGYWATPPVFAIVARDRVEIFFKRADRSTVPTEGAAEAYDAYIHIDGVDALAAELRARGADILDGPDTRDYGQRELVVRDCNGRVLAFGEDTSSRTG